jgi:uncharacterized protein (DUF1501 family)
MNKQQAGWLGCDGAGNALDASVPSALHTEPIASGLSATRRGFLLGTALATVAWVSRSATSLADVAVSPDKADRKGDILVTVFMRGGADGLNLLVPHFDGEYYKHRPNLAVPAPGDGRAAASTRALDLDGRFGLNPVLAPLLSLYREGLMGCLHAVGSGDKTRSHFEAMSAMERGLPNEETGSASGWLARHLGSTQGANSSPLRAVAFSNVMPDSLRGATDATALNSLNDFRLVMPEQAPKGADVELRSVLKEIYRDGKDAIAQAGRETLDVLDTLNRIDPVNYKPAGGAAYPQSDFGNGLRQVACLIKGRVGLEVACLDHRGPYLWDTHVAQGTVFAAQAGDLANGLAAFVKDVGTEMSRVTVIVMTEFGRRLQENSGLGTDHGRGGAMFLLGGGTIGGKIHGEWPGLGEKQLDEVGDLRVATDYRDVLAEVVQKRLHNNNLSTVFPEYSPKPIGVVNG